MSCQVPVCRNDNPSVAPQNSVCCFFFYDPLYINLWCNGKKLDLLNLESRLGCPRRPNDVAGLSEVAGWTFPTRPKEGACTPTYNIFLETVRVVLYLRTGHYSLVLATLW